MIGRLQKTKILEQITQARMRMGRFPYLKDVIPAVNQFLKNKRLGAPLASLRPVVLGQPIGGAKGTDIADTFNELRDDLVLLYTALIDLAARNIDLYDVFAARRDRLTAKIRQLKLDIQTLLAQNSAASRASITESFHTLDNVDQNQTTAVVDLTEGSVSLPPNSSNSVKYDGTKIQVVNTILPPGGTQVGPPFQSVFSPYRLDAWYASLPVGSTYEAQINITGADYSKSNAEEVSVNAVSIQPTGPIHIDISWSPDGQNWYPLDPSASITTSDVYTFHFTPVSLGFLRFRIKHSESVSAAAPAGQTRPVGIKRIEILSRGYSTTASLYSNEYDFSETVNNVVAEVQADLPIGTRAVSYLSLTQGGPWTLIQGGPVTFDTRVWQDLNINTVTPEQPGVPQTMWRFPVPDSQLPQPDTGEMIAGRGQIQISAYSFDWRLMGDPYHIPDIADWKKPLSEVRTRPFISLGQLNAVSGIVSTAFTDNQNPIAVDLTNGGYMVAAIIDANGTYVLQPGHNYRILSYVWAQVPTSLQNQQIGIVNTNGVANTKVAPLAVYVNGSKIFQNQVAATSISALSNSQYQTTIPLVQGINEIQILLQLPVTGTVGIAANNVFLYFQPNLFDPNLPENLNVSYIQAYKNPWTRVSEFNLRYNTPPGVLEVWAWDENLSGTQGVTLDWGKLQYVLFNHDPTNTQSGTGYIFQTIDGFNTGVPANLTVRYPSDRNLDTPTNSLFFRSDLFQDAGASSPPILRGYRLLVN